MYITVILNKESVDKLKEEISPKYPEVFYHHMTLVYNPSEEEYEKYEDMLGETVEFKVVKHCFDDKCQAVLVDTDLSMNEYPHITLSCTEDTKPTYSNQMLEGSSCEDVSLILSGEIAVLSSSS